MTNFDAGRFIKLRQSIKRLSPGLSLTGLVAMSAQFDSQYSQAPAMMIALLLGMITSFVHETDLKAGPGVHGCIHR